MLRAGFQLAALAFFAAISLASAGSAQSGSPTHLAALNQDQAPTALVRSVKVALPTEAAAVEIITTRPMIPVISVVGNPPRLVIDLPNSLIAAAQRVGSRNQPIQRVRVNQFQKKPPSVRVVVDLAEPASYSWDEAGNRLMIRLRPQGQASTPAAARPPAAATRAMKPANRAGSVVLASSRTIMSSSVSAGAHPAVLHLQRGGEVRVCPGTTISVTASQTGRDMLLGMSTGALETHYRLQSAADSVLTPDFRIVPSGAGEFDYAVSADARGNTCVRALPGNTASAMVSELLGDGTYEVKPSEQVVFHDGRLAGLDAALPADCGCSAAAIPVIRASAAPAGHTPSPNQTPVGGDLPLSSTSPESASLPPATAKDVHVQVDAPFVFRASEAQPTPAQELETANLPLAGSERPNLLKVIVLPPPGQRRETAVQPPHRGFLGKIKGFFAGVFR